MNPALSSLVILPEHEQVSPESLEHFARLYSCATNPDARAAVLAKAEEYGASKQQLRIIRGELDA